MRLRPFIWLSLVLLCLAGAWLLWPRAVSTRTKPSALQNIAAPAVATVQPASTALKILTPVYTSSVKLGLALAGTNKFAFRLANTGKTIGQLTGDRHAILLENALIDTGSPLNFSIPAHLQSQDDPGAYIVQARGPIDNAFRAMLARSGATIVSYIPNDAYLVRAPVAAANGLAGNPLTQAVISYEPYYKISSSMSVTVGQKSLSSATMKTNRVTGTSLLALAVKQAPLPAGTCLTLGLFSDGAAATVAQIEKLGGQIIARDSSPFGPVVRVQPPTDWVALATLPGVQIVEPYRQRVRANDLSRATVGVAADTQVSSNYLGLTGKNVLVEVNDSGIDATHPDLINRVFGAPITDTDSHGTHVAGIIAGDGTESATVTNAQGSIMPATNGQFRGMAPLANLFSMDWGASDQKLQAAAAQTNALISNNSWNFGGDSSYDLAAASYDAAVRDALPEVTGSQPVLFVFSAGNSGSGGNSGGGGNPDTILSPATAKNVITVGALEQLRGITNIVTKVVNGVTNTSTPWELETDTSYEVAGFSSRGNVGIGTEGTFGRYKPDVVAPGTFVVSTRSQQWDEEAYYNPTNYDFNTFSNQVVTPDSLNYSIISVPANAVGVIITIGTNNNSPVPFPANLPIYVEQADLPTTNTYDFVTMSNGVSIPPNSGGAIAGITSIQNDGFFYAVGDSTNFAISYDLTTEIITTNDLGNYFQVLSNLNNTLDGDPDSLVKPHWYRYETGTSMSAADVSGVLALMADYFTNILQTTPSPALLKGMLINGARATGLYNFHVQNSINYEGWGLASAPNALPPGQTTNFNTACDSFFLDQNPNAALATGDSHTFNVTISTNAAALPLRVTLVWTDPPGNPAAAIKLVNDLDLVVTNFDDPTNPIVYYGNDIPASSVYNSPWDTSGPPNLDLINNIENVFLPPLLGTNYSITVVGREVNVNAVTANTNNVVQDYALVISCGEGEVTNAFTVTTNAASFISNLTGDQQITFVTTTNQPLLNQFVGASSPLLGTNKLAIGTNSIWGTNGNVTIGMTNQWHFYVVTNTGANDFTNAAFITFNPDTLSIPRMGVFANSVGNATRTEADIDLFVTTDSNLLTLNPITLSNCLNGAQIGGSSAGGTLFAASLTRGGTEFVVDTNSKPGRVYYIGVQSEDQMASEYGFIPIFTDIPFSQPGPNGSEIVNGLNVPVNIPDGSTVHPGIGYVFAIAINPMEVKRGVVTSIITHQNFGDLIGSLRHGSSSGVSQSVVLNNHVSLFNLSGIYTNIYDDSGEGDIIGSRPSDGPGNLNSFVGQQAIGLWMLTEVDDSLTQTGSVASFNLFIEPHQDLGKGIIVTIPSGGLFVDYVDVPVGYRELILSATNVSVEGTPSVPVGTLPVQMFENYGSAEILTNGVVTNYDQEADLTNCLLGAFPTGTDPGNSLSTGPPLPSGFYFAGLFNPPGNAPQQIFLIADLIPEPVVGSYETNTLTPVTIPDDAVTNSSIFIAATQQIASLSVGLIVANARISDLSFTLISPTGQRILLMENRGGGSVGNLGHANITTNFFGTQTAGGALAATNVIGPVGTAGTLLINYDFFTVPDTMDVYYDGVDIFSSGPVSYARQFVINYGPGFSTNIVIVMNQGNNPSLTAWEYTPSVVSLDYTYVTFTEDTNLTDTPIKFAIPPYDLANDATNFTLSDFESATNGDYFGFTNIFDALGGWTLPTNLVTYTTVFTNNAFAVVTNVVLHTNNEVSVVTDPVTAYGGSNYLALASGVMTRTIPVTVGRKYSLSYAYRGPGIAGWWRGEGNATDSADPENTGNNGSLIGRFNFPAGEVGQAFQMEDLGNEFQFAGTNNYVQIRQAPFIVLVSTNGSGDTNLVPVQTSYLDVGVGGGFTIEGWINPTNVGVGQPLVEWLARVPTNGADTNLVIKAGPFLDRDTGHYYYLLGGTNWTISEKWATQLGGHLVTLETANEQNWVYDTFAQFASINRNLWIGLTNDGVGHAGWSSGETNVTYSNWAPGQPPPTLCSPGDFYTAILGPTNAYPGLWVLENNTGTNNNGVTCGVSPSNHIYGVVEVNDIQTNGVQFWISVTNTPGTTNAPFAGTNGCLYANLVDITNGSHEIISPPGLIQTNIYQHVALTYNTNSGIAALYYNGTNVAFTNLGVFVPKTTGDVLLGKDMSRLTNNFYSGKMDEMSIYRRALSDAEISAIYRVSALATNGLTGKFDPSITPALSLAEARVTLSTVGTNFVLGENTNWLVQGFTFTPTTNSLQLQITGLEPGLLLDSFGLSEASQGNLYYLPEQSLASLNGVNANGTWTLEIWDNRTGGAVTNAQLVSWQLQFTVQTNVPITLNANTATTNTVPPGGIAYYAINVPVWAAEATNLLVSATHPVDLLFNQTNLPTGSNPGDFIFVTNNTSGSFTMFTNVPPPQLLPGQTYFLGVRNPGPFSSTVVVEVDFNITTLSNGIPFRDVLSTNASDVERYFAFDVSSNASEATFQLLKLSGNADLVVRKGTPLPTLTGSDYGSFNTGNADENIYVLTNSLPVPLSAGRWYLGVFRRTPGPINYSILAKELDPQTGPPSVPNIIDLTNSVPFNFTAGTGAALTNFFRFTVTNTSPTNLVGSIRFELYNLSSNGDLTVQTNALPLAPPFFQTSQSPGRTPEFIFIHTNSVLTNLAAAWYLGVPNREITNITFTILAVIDTNGYFPAFPGAEGAGGGAAGGAGAAPGGGHGTNGTVYHVFTLDDSGFGSLRDAVGSSNRTVVFDVSGTITLLSPLIITNSYLTIAGQTAPDSCCGGGITVAGPMTLLQNAHDVVLRYLRFRPVSVITNVSGVAVAAIGWHSSFEGHGNTNYSPGGGTYFAEGWHVDSVDHLDVLTNGFDGGAAYEGTHYIDLNGDNPATISTNVPTVPGQTYMLSFAYSRNPGGSPPAVAQLLIAGNPLLTLSVTINNSWPNLGWATTSVVFTATSPSTKIQFASQTPGAYGVLLDAIDMAPVNGVGGFEGAAAVDYPQGRYVDGWKITRNQVTVIADSTLAAGGAHLLALADGVISNTLATVPGRTYTLTFAYRGPGAISLWRAQDKNGNNSPMDSVDGNSFVFTTALGYTNGEVGKAFVYNGTSSSAEAFANPNLDVGSGSGFTLDAWINPASLIDITSGYLPPTIFEWNTGSGSGNASVGVQFYISGAGVGTLSANLEDTTTVFHNIASANTAIVANVFQHVALTFNKVTGVAVLYRNGVVVATANLGTTWTPETGSGFNLYLGHRPAGTFNSIYFDGMIDEPTVYKRDLSASEILAIYNHSSLGKYDTSAQSIALGLAKAQVVVGGVSSTLFGNNASWQTTNLTFVATQGNTPLQITGLEPGMLMDSFALTQYVTSNLIAGNSLQFTNVMNVIADHISTSWSTNDLVSVLNSTNLTMQWSIMADSLNDTNHPQGYGSRLRYGYGGLSFHHNLYADNYSANPYLDDNLTLDFVNNVIYNWGIHSGYSGTNDPVANPNGQTNRLNYVCNYLIAGPDTAFYSTNASQTNIAFWGGITNTWIFQSNNIIDSDTNGILNGANTGWTMFTNHYTPFGQPFPLPQVPPDEAFIAYERVLDFAGASLCKRDGVDANIVTGVRTQTGRIISTPPSSGLVALWKGENNALDSVGTNDGLLYNGVGFAPGQVGQSFLFNGSNSFVQIPSSPALMPTGPFSLDAWVNYDYQTSMNGGMIAMKGQDVEVPADWAFSISGAHKLRPHVNLNGGWYYFDCNTTLQTGVWYNVAMVYNGTNIQGFVNGVLDGAISASGTVRTSNNPMKIGTYASTTPPALTSFFAGRIDELSLYNRAITPAEIQAIYNAESRLCSDTPPLDSDQDGIPDYWEITFGQSPTNASNNQLSTNVNYLGYTDLEEYQGWLAAPHALTVTNTPVGVDLFKLFGKTGNLSFSVTNAIQGFVFLTNVLGSVTNTGLFSNSIAVFTPSNNYSGYASFDVSVTNNDTLAHFGPVTVSVMVSAVPILKGGIVTLTNLVPYYAFNLTGTDGLDYYRYNVSSNAYGVKFEILNATRNVTLLARYGLPLPSIGSYDYISANPGTNNELILVLTNSLPVPLTNGWWYLAVSNASGAPVNYTIMASELVANTNPPPVFLTNPTNVTMDEMTTLIVTNAATDANTNLTLAYALVNPPAWASINPNTGVITLAPQEADGPTNVTITTIVVDNGSPPSSAQNNFTVTVNEVNTPPFWLPNVPGQTNYIINDLSTLTVMNTATDTDIPVNPLTYQLFGPTNATIDTNGVITWTPTPADIGSNYVFTTIVTDTNPWAINAKSLSATNSFTVTVTMLINLAGGQPQTNTIAAGGIDYYAVNVPPTADFATNILDFASGPLNVWFNQTNLPVTINPSYYLLLGGVTSGIGSPILGTNTTPPLLPGLTYYLAVQNTNSFAVTYGIEVDFHNTVSTGLVTVAVATTSPGYAIPADFSGLSFETGSERSGNAGTSGYMFSGTNTQLITLFQNVALKNLRMGGGSVDDETPPGLGGDGYTGIDNLFNFVQQAGVKVIYSVRLLGPPSYVSSDAVIAQYIWQNYKPQLDCFAIGNEPDWKSYHYPPFGTGPDPTIFDYPSYLADWRSFANAITNVAPGAKFAGPDTGAYTTGTYYNGQSWTQRFADDERSSGIILAVLQHYYVGASPGSATAQQAIDAMLSPGWNTVTNQWLYDNNLAPVVADGLPYRLTESNDYLGGVPNASNAFASALWALDYMHWWAAHNCAGVNFHNKQWILTDTIYLDPFGNYQINPKAYGIKAFDVGGHGYVEPLTMNNTNGVNLTTYAVWDTTNLYVTIINKEHGIGARDAVVTIAPNGYMSGSVAAMFLAAPNGNAMATSGVTLGGASPPNNAPWPGQWTVLNPLTNGQCTVTVPATTAAIVKIQAAAPSVASNSITWTLINVPTNAIAATNTLFFASLPVNVWFSTNAPPTITNANDVDLMPNATNGVSVLTTNSAPANIVPGGVYFIGVQNTNSLPVTYDLAVNFLLAPTNPPPPPISLSGITATNIGGKFGFLLTWFAPTNDLFKVQWTGALNPPVTWNTFSNIIGYSTFISPTNSRFIFFDDGSQTGGFGPMRFYRLILLQSTNVLTLPAQSNLVINALTPLVVTNTATDSNTNTTLSYLLTTSPPTGAVISTNGIITWTPALAQAGSSNTFTTVVTDNGLPPTRATNSFIVTVNPPPVAISGIAITTNGLFQLQWSAATNYQFQVAWTTNLLPPVVWNYIPPGPPYITSTVTNFTFVDTNAPTTMKFYRLLEYP